MEQENQTKNRVSRIEEFLLDPEKTLFELLEEFGGSVEEIRNALSQIDVANLETLKGEDGKTPERGVDYFTDEDLDNIEAFILDRIPVVGEDVPSAKQVNEYIDKQVAKIPRVKGDKGNPGTPGKPGKDGSPDSALDIIKKLRSLDKNQGLQLNDIRGLSKKIALLNEVSDEFTQLKEDLNKIKIFSSGGGSDGAGYMLASVYDPAGGAKQVAFASELHNAVTVTDSTEINFTLIGQDITASIKNGSIDETKLDTSVNNSLDLADTAIQTETDPLSLHLDQTTPQTFTGGDVVGSGLLKVTSGELGLDSTTYVSGTPWTSEGYLTDISGQDLSMADNSTSAFITLGDIPAETDPVVGAITGIVKANGAGTISAANAGTDYQAPLVADTDYLTPGTAASTYLTSVGTGVANEITYWSGTNTLGSLATATYPSLTELSYVKGVTSAIQTQLGNKAPLASPTFTGTVTTPAIKITTGAGANKVLTSDADGDATWETPVSADSTTTFTNKRITPRVTTITSSATPTINTDNCDAVTITALAEAITSFTTNLSGTPTNFQKLIIRIKDNGTARAITWGDSFEAKGVALPTTTTLSKVMTLGFIWDSVTSKWGLVASCVEA